MSSRLVAIGVGSVLSMGVLLAGMALAPPPASTPAQPADHVAAPKRVILLIGDGMGLSQLAAASMIEYGPQGGFTIETSTHIGLVRTCAADRVVTDSGAAATALATGFKTTYYGVSMEPGGITLRTLFEAAQDKGLATAAMTTTFLFDATPAAFTSHAVRRGDIGSIINQMVDGRTNVLLGGDANIFAMAEQGNEGAVRVRDMLDARVNTGALHLVTDPAALPGANTSAPEGRIVGLFPRRNLNVADANSEDVFGPQLVDMLGFTLDRIGDDPDGFFVMAECEETDSGGHANDTDRVVRGVKELDAALGRALEFAKTHPDTLIIVTADHDTGDAQVAGDRTDRLKPVIVWTTKDHSAEWVPLYAFGPGAEKFTGVMDNTDVAKRLGAILDLPDFPKRIMPDSPAVE